MVNDALECPNRLETSFTVSPGTVAVTNQGDFGLVGVDMLSSSEVWAVGTNNMCHFTGSWECHGTAYPI